jgi:hypothetical protein
MDNDWVDNVLEVGMWLLFVALLVRTIVVAT